MYEHRDKLTRLVSSPTDLERVTARKDCDAREAVARGLKEYLEQLHIDAPTGGRRLTFVAVKATYGDLWEPVKCPAANVHGGVGDADYDAAKTSGTPIECDDSGKELSTGRDGQGQQLPGTFRRAWFAPSSFEVDLNVEVWAQDLGERSLLALMLEDDFNPTPDWLGGGFRLELPHYCGSRADYHLKAGSISYEGRSAQQNKYLLKYAIEAKLDLRVPRNRPRVTPIINASANGVTERVPL